jgi:methyl-accepting chemotaxis protein
MLQQLSIRSRILISVAVLVTVAASIAAVGAFSSAALEKKIVELTGVQRERDALSDEWDRGNQANVERWAALALAGSPELYAKYKPLTEATTERISVIQKRLREIEQDPRLLKLLDELATDRTAWLADRDKVRAAIEAGDFAAAKEVGATSLAASAKRYVETSRKMVNFQQERTTEITNAAKADITLAERVNMALLAAAVLIGGLVATLLTRAVMRPVESTAATLREIASGNLAAHVPAEAPREFRGMLSDLTAMRDNLHQIVSQLAQTSESIRTASSEVAVGNQDLSGRTEQAASNLQQTAASMAQLSQTVNQNAEAARTASQLAASASSVAQQGGDVVGQVVDTMNDITASSKKIGEIIGVIDSIAFQTNILALNASVEAARAGEQGRGFAVVASEVRNLAQRSAEAAKEIKTLIGASAEKVETGSQLVEQAGATMNEIVASVRRVTDMIGEITASTTEQASGITQVNQAVGHLDQMTQQNAALVEQSAAAAESLKAQAVQLGEVVGSFRLQRA